MVMLSTLSCSTVFAATGEHLLSGTQQATQQNVARTITGTVVDANDNSPIIGATIQVRGTQTRAITDVDGNFSIKATSRDALEISYLGFKTQTVEIGSLGVINVKMESSNELLNEIVVVGAGVQKKVSVTGAITNVAGKSLAVPNSSLTTSFAGRLVGVISNVSSGAPGEAASFYIRGVSTFGGRATPLIMLDDVEISAQDLNNIPAETIESFSILKDASATAIYGARGANGVMLITTKSGKNNERTQVNVSLENSFNVMTAFPDFVDGATWMSMYDEAGQARSVTNYTRRYTEDYINRYRNSTDRLRYPDVSWQDVIFKKMAMSQRANINVQGGGSKASYYLSLQANHDTGLLNTRKVYSYNNNVNNWAYNFQNNIKYNLTSTTTIDLRMNAQIRNSQGPNYSMDNLFKMTLGTNPISFPVTYPAQEGDQHVRFGGAILSGTNVRVNPYAYMLTSYKQTQQNTINTSLKITQKFDFITKGLKATALVNFKNWSQNYYSRTIEPYYYRMKDGSYDEQTGAYELERVGSSGTDYIAESAITKDGDNTFFLQFTLDYNRQFGKHTIGGMLLYMQREYRNAILPHRNQGFSGRFTYDYDTRYLAEVNFGYNGTERLAKKDRFEFFPAISLGWVISNEKFFQPLQKAVTSLKLRGSYGLVGSDETGTSAGAPHFLYIDQVNVIGNGRPGFTLGEDLNVTRYGPLMTQYALVNGGWERVKKLDLGFDLVLFDDLNITFDYFFDHRYNILLHREAWPESLGYYTAKPWSNKGKVDNKGFEVSATYHHRFNKDLSAELRGNFTYTQNKYIDLDEPLYPYVWKTYTGKPLNPTYGYIAEGLFKSQEEIDNSPVQTGLGSTPLPGDIKYRDVDGNGIINSNDQVMISEYGRTPRIQYGLGLNVDYKGFNVGLFFNGSAKRTIMINDNITPFGQSDNNVLKFISENYWSESNPDPNAAYPRLGITNSQVGNNMVNSTFWMRNGSFLRFKTLEIGYRFKKYARVYMTADNLLTISSFKEWDPELASWYSYPFQRTFNFGVQLTF
uniref:TonB-dependent receptor n=1 Tax=Prevotella sp. GTC17260 TaxID=3236796 RepID=A0AB33JI16_9BACT